MPPGRLRPSRVRTAAHLPRSAECARPGGVRGQRRRMPGLPGRQRLESRRQRRPGGRELGRAARRDVAGQRRCIWISERPRSTTAFPTPSCPADQPLVPIDVRHRRRRLLRRERSGTDADSPDAPIEGGSTADPESRLGRPARARGSARANACSTSCTTPSAPRAASSVSSSARWDLKVNATRPAGWTSADAAGLPILPGLLQLRRGGGRRDQPRTPFHRPARAARLRGAGEPLRPVRGRHPAPLRHASAAQGRLLPRAVHRRRAGHAHRAQALRPDARRPGQRMVRDGNVGSRAGRTRWISCGRTRCAAATSSCCASGAMTAC